MVCQVTRLVVVAAVLAPGGCATNVHVSPDLAQPPVLLRVAPDRPWTETDVLVRRGEWFFFRATGEVAWGDRHATAGPDGIKGDPGWTIGDGGLIGRVDSSNETFDIGSRTQLFADPTRRPQYGRAHPPPPIRMPADGRLQLGFKQFAPGANRGSFEVTIQRGWSGH